jgi:aminoglycoside phosphotransferase (APT) family kinase protein
MTGRRMHADEMEIDVSLVGRLLAAQFPRWADLPIEPVQSAGTENAIYRLGDDMAVRLPRHRGAAGQVDTEQRWLARLAAHLPLAIPVPLATGRPADGYPWHWSVSPWLHGEIATADHIADPRQTAIDLARFMTALQRIDPTGGPPASRGLPLATRDDLTREAIASLRGTLDAGALTDAWQAALRAPEWPGPPVWVHGDLYDGNLLAEGGRLTAVIDFGGLGVGDPACDLIVAWSLFCSDAHAAFRVALGVDDATWARGRGWALSVALIALPYYRHTNPVMVANATHRIAEVLADHTPGP